MGHEGWKDQGRWGEFPVEEWMGWGGGSLAARLLGQWSLSHSANLQWHTPLPAFSPFHLSFILHHLHGLLSDSGLNPDNPGKRRAEEKKERGVLNDCQPLLFTILHPMPLDKHLLVKTGCLHRGLTPRDVGVTWPSYRPIWPSQAAVWPTLSPQLARLQSTPLLSSDDLISSHQSQLLLERPVLF
ncbi:hypothetical protein SRHO_G00024300 [Serrasalmus rhombeus]